MSQTPYTFSGTLAYPPDEGQAAADRAFSVSGVFEEEAKFELVLEGASSHVVGFGTIGPNGAKAVLIKVDPDASPSAAPVNVQLNGGGAGGEHEISPGGFWAYSNPNPTAGGILSMIVVHTTNAVVHVWILG